MKSKFNLGIEGDLLREDRVLDAEDNSSVNALLSAKLEDVAPQGRGFQRARRSAVARLQNGFDLNWTPPRSRDELYYPQKDSNHRLM
jgi:hypothetical protein